MRAAEGILRLPHGTLLEHVEMTTTPPPHRSSSMRYTTITERLSDLGGDKSGRPQCRSSANSGGRTDHRADHRGTRHRHTPGAGRAARRGAARRAYPLLRWPRRTGAGRGTGRALLSAHARDQCRQCAVLSGNADGAVRGDAGAGGRGMRRTDRRPLLRHL